MESSGSVYYCTRAARCTWVLRVRGQGQRLPAVPCTLTLSKGLLLETWGQHSRQQGILQAGRAPDPFTFLSGAKHADR